MAVVLTKNPAYWAEGFFVIPDQPGRPIVIDFRLRFKRLKKAEADELDRRIRINSEHHQAQLRAIVENRPVPQFVPEITDKEVLDAVLVDWEGFNAEDGTAAMYTDATRTQLCDDYPGMEAAMVRAWLESRQPAQQREAAAKNSEALPATT